jgi:hypothetical protein
VVIHLRAKPIRLAIGRHALGNQKRLLPEKHSFPGIGKIIARQQNPFTLPTLLGVALDSPLSRCAF